MYFLRVEVVLQDATYFIVFTDADTIPPTIRLDNYSEVPLQFHQACLKAYTVLYIATEYLWFLVFMILCSLVGRYHNYCYLCMKDFTA
jgi:hypothetical protein